MTMTVENSPLLRRVMQEVDPGYFALSPDEQERYRASIPPEKLAEITRRVRSALFGETHADAVDADDEDRLSIADEQRLIETMLPVEGIGEDCIRLNEQLYDRTLLDYETLADYCRTDHAYQEKWRAKEFAGYAPKPWRGALEPVAAWLFLDGVYTFAQTQSAAGRVLDALRQYGDDIIDAAIPHRFVEGPKHGEPVEGGYLWDMVLKANGREDELRALQDAFRRWTEQAGEALLNEWAGRVDTQIWILDSTDEWGRGVDFVFSGPAAFEAVRFRYFVSDCRANAITDTGPLERCEATWRQRLDAWISERIQNG